MMISRAAAKVRPGSGGTGPGPPRARDSGLHRRPGPPGRELSGSGLQKFTVSRTSPPTVTDVLPLAGCCLRGAGLPGRANTRCGHVENVESSRRAAAKAALPYTHTHKECLSKSTYPKGIRSLFLKRTVNSMIPATLRDRGTC